ncbi:MAG: hypothetical protein CJBNEKGG_02724 [Prosthecobacter sp.]|nr:hypothetical protein [Prosthecobacter sp.]
MKTAIIILSDPKAGEDALGRAFNALALARESRQAGDDVLIAFSGAGTRWPAEFTKPAHPAGALYQEVRDLVTGLSCGCAKVFGADTCGLPEKSCNAIPGTPGVLSLREYLADGRHVVVF